MGLGDETEVDSVLRVLLRQASLSGATVRQGNGQDPADITHRGPRQERATNVRFREWRRAARMAGCGWKLDIAPLANFPDGALVTDQLYIFLAEAIATEVTDKRPGARHALMLYASGSTMDWARGRATKHADEAGWLHVEVKREKELNRDTSLIADPTLRTAADAALARGSAIVIYGNEIPTHS